LEDHAVPKLDKYRLVACSVFSRELFAILAASQRIVDLEFLEVALHEHSDNLRAQLQAAIDKVEGKGYAAILLAYGLCGNALAGVRAGSVPLVLPRAHDCCTVLLGSGKSFINEFGDSLSAPWSSCGYMERGSDYMRTSETGRSNGFGLEYADMVAQYGEDNARYLWETLHPEHDEPVYRFIELPSSAHLGRADIIRQRAMDEGKDFRLIQGDERMLRALVDGPWDPADFLVVQPGQTIKAVYDFEQVVTAAH
jgi:hypothetical protein